jgi:hypothetical protein
MMAFEEYLHEIRDILAHGDATEHTYRPALKKLFESVGQGIIATNEPTRILCGAPDFNISKGKVPLGHVETKNVGENLAAMEKGKPPHGEQFGRYRDGLPNWILTDYLEFRWYVNGESRIQHYQKVIVSLSETIRLMQEIDESIPNWPIQ